MEIDAATADPEVRRALRLSDAEREVLELYDRLEDIQLEMNLIRAQEAINDDDLNVTTDDIEQAKADLLDARARYTVRRTIVESVLLANPILKAVHAGANASSAEQELLPLVEQRDALSIDLTRQSAALSQAHDSLTTTAAAHARLMQDNTEVARRVLELAEQLADAPRAGGGGDGEEDAALTQLRAAVKTSRQRWRIMKGTVSAIVVGSGVDWSRDPALTDLVLEIDSDDET